MPSTVGASGGPWAEPRPFSPLVVQEPAAPEGPLPTPASAYYWGGPWGHRAAFVTPPLWAVPTRDSSCCGGPLPLGWTHTRSCWCGPAGAVRGLVGIAACCPCPLLRPLVGGGRALAIKEHGGTRADGGLAGPALSILQALLLQAVCGGAPGHGRCSRDRCPGARCMHRPSLVPSLGWTPVPSLLLAQHHPRPSCLWAPVSPW